MAPRRASSSIPACIVIGLLLMLGLIGCQNTRPVPTPASSPAPLPVAPPPPPPPPPPPGDTPNIARGTEFSQVRVFFATDRRAQADSPGVYGGARGAGLGYGALFVSVPARHKTGEIERPSLWRLEASEDPALHMSILRRTVMGRDEFIERVRASRAEGTRSASFVFIHGYNVGFDDAARRTAQIAYDLEFAGAPVFYSWPSQASLQGYTTDENNVEWSTPHLRAFLADYADHSGVDDIYLIAHSMGNRALVGALRQLFAERPDLRARFREIILTAPDIDADIFKRDIAPALAGIDAANPAPRNKVTLYVSDGDKALLASKGLHGYARAGDSSEGIVIADGIETIDASGLDTSFLEHSYFAETGSVLDDIRKIVRERLRAKQRGLAEKSQPDAGAYWSLRPATAP